MKVPMKTPKMGLKKQLGLSSTVGTLIILSIIGVLNFISYKHPQKYDVTKNKVHTLTEQSSSTVKRFTSDVQAIVFATGGMKEQFRPILENYRDVNPKFKLEFVDPSKELQRVKALGIKKQNTLHLQYGEKQKVVDDLTEEKITNALLGLLDTKKLTVCMIKGHDEKEIGEESEVGYSAIKLGLENQAVAVREVMLPSEVKVPDDCTSLLIAGPAKSFLPSEIKNISDYLTKGGGLVVAMDLNLKGQRPAAELDALIEKFGVKVTTAMVVEPASQIRGMDASVPIVINFSKSHAVTKDVTLQAYMPLTRAIEISDKPPADTKVEWLAQTSPVAWGEVDLNQLKSGKVQNDKGKDKPGPLNLAAAIETKTARIVVFGTSLFGVNQWSKMAGNSDLMLNSISWTLKDENQITIRTQPDEPGRIQMTQAQATGVFWSSVVFVPLLISGTGIAVWWRRKKL